MKYCAFYTEGFYQEVAEQYIIPSAKKVGVELHTIKKPSAHDWQKNTAMKAKIIQDCLTEFNDDIVMVDADATFEQYPKLFDEIPEEYQIAVHYLDVDKFWHNKEGSQKRQLCSGTIMFRNSFINKELIIMWMRENEKHPEILEQMNLQNLLNHSPIKVYHLPISYCAIIRHDGVVPDWVTDIVIKHHQMSRTGKRRA